MLQRAVRRTLLLHYQLSPTGSQRLSIVRVDQAVSQELAKIVSITHDNGGLGR
jgi:hypothetical protein